MHVLVVSIGPVQEFIASARKCRDLWFGSWLLSELSREMARKITEVEGRAEADVLVFPGAKTEDRGRSVANRIVARVEKEPAWVAGEGEKAMRARLREIRDAAFAMVAPGVRNRSDLFKIETAREQVDGLIELLWAAAPEKESYTAARREAERLLAAVKNSKDWEQPPWAMEGVVKSSLDGVRESVLDESLFERPRVERGGEKEDHRLRRLFGVHGSERLCGVGLLKRFGNVRADEHGRARPARDGTDPHRIFSTTHVASGPFREGLKQIDAGERWAKFCNDLKAIEGGLLGELDVAPDDDSVTQRIDGSVFYEARLGEQIEELAETEKVAGERTSEAVAALRGFLSSVRELGEPSPYYAILLADGDHMGAVIDGCESFGEHRKLSAALETFASGARDTVKDHGGRLVYSGGDDVLALLPLHRVLACAKRLADDFAGSLGGWRATIQGDERAPTLSVGVAIVHHLLPLFQALELARGCEKRAKEVPGKNGLAITVKKRGGEAVEVAGTVSEVRERVERLVDMHRRGEISAKAQFELMDLAQRSAHAADEKLAATLKCVAEAEARRILARKQPRKGRDRELAEGVLDALKQFGAFSDPARLGRELYVAQQLARAEEQARVALRERDAESVVTGRKEESR